MGFFQSIGKAIGSVASPLVSGAFGIGSSLLNNKSQSDTNKTNMQIAQMNNEWSEKMMEKQHSYDLEMWNKNNEYNSAEQQRKRLEEAGLNPSLMMNGGSAGTAQGGSSVGMPSPTTPNLQPLRYDGFSNAINNSVHMLMAIQKNNSDIDNANKNTDANVALARAKIAREAEETRNVKFRNTLNDITKDLQVTHMQEDYLRKVQERANMEEQQKLIQQQIVAQQLINEQLPEELAMNIAVLTSQKAVNEENVKYIAEATVRQSLENKKIDYTKEQFERYKDATISALEASIGQGWINAASNAFNSVLDGISSFGGRKAPKIYQQRTHYTSIYNR